MDKAKTYPPDPTASDEHDTRPWPIDQQHIDPRRHRPPQQRHEHHLLQRDAQGAQRRPYRRGPGLANLPCPRKGDHAVYVFCAGGGAPGGLERLDERGREVVPVAEEVGAGRVAFEREGGEEGHHFRRVAPWRPVSLWKLR